MGLGGRRGGQPAVHDRIGVFCRQAWKAQTLFHRSDRDHGFADSVGHLLCLLRFVGRCRQMVVRPVGLFLCCLFRYQHRPVGVAYHLRSISPETQGIGLIHRFLVRVVFNSIVSFTFFKIVHAFTISGTEIYAEGENLGNPAGAFWFYAVVALAALIWGYFYVPETKGVSLEKIEEYWRKGGKPRFLK